MTDRRVNRGVIVTEDFSTPLLDTIKLPADMKGLSLAELKQLADELRDRLTAMGIELEDKAGKTNWRKL